MPPKGAPPKEKRKSSAGKKEPKEKEVPLTPAEVLRLEALDVVPGLLTQAFDGAIEILQERSIGKKVAAYTATRLREAVTQTLELFHIGADPGECDLLDQTWTADEEPTPVANDTWSRDILAMMGPEAKLVAKGGARARAPFKLAVPDTGASSRISLDAGMSHASWAAHAKLFDAPPPPKAREDLSRSKVDIYKVEADAQRVPPR
jgi:hypothetical protein